MGHGHVALTHWPLWVSIKQGLKSKSLLWFRHNLPHTQSGASLPAIVQQNVLGQRGDGYTFRIWKYSAACGMGQLNCIPPYLVRVANSQV